MSLFDGREESRSLEEIQAAGIRAAQVLDDEVFQEAWEEAEMAIVKRWLGFKTTDERESCWYAMQALEAVRAQLRTIQSNGEVAKNLLEQRDS